MDILDWIEKAKNFKTREFLNDFAFDIYEDEKSVEYQKEQWKAGLSQKGEEIGYYKKSTEEITGGRKIYGELWDLKDSGDFYNKTYLSTLVQPRKKDVLFGYGSDGDNKRKLFKTIREYGLIVDPDDIFGLHDPYMEKFIKLIEPKFVQQLNNYYDV